MLSTERQQFEVELAVLFGGWPRVLITQERKEAYWRGLQKMPLSMFARCVDTALSDQGPKDAKDSVPTPNMLWQISRKIQRGNQPAKTPGNDNSATATDGDLVDGLTGSCLLVFLGRKCKPFDLREDGTGASNRSLIAMIKAKKAIAAAARDDAALVRALKLPKEYRSAEDKAAIKDLRKVCISAFEKLWQARAPEEIEADRECFERTYHVRGFSADELAELGAAP